MSRASTDADAACSAVDTAQMLAPQVDAAVRAGSFDWNARGPGAPGLVEEAGHIRVDWPELALAVGPGAANIALITVGGAAPRGTCSDPEQLVQWTARGETLAAAPSCMQDALRDAYATAVERHLDLCLCDAPSDAEAAAVARLAPLLDAMGLEETADQVRDWPDTWKACPTEP